METPDGVWITFSSALGLCGLSWNVKGITSFQLSGASGQLIKKRLMNITGNVTASSTPPDWIKKLVQKVKEHLKGNVQDFSSVPLNFGGASEFQIAVYRAARKVPSGTVVTYGELAALIGKPKASRAVGSALGKNPIPLIVPCHRVITSSGKVGGFSAFGGVQMKVALLCSEGVIMEP
jgi:methylated-DNA-[protein]-cysteine S-methyltransferase